MAYTIASGEAHIDLDGGDDSVGDGTIGSPWKTLNNVTTEALVLFRNGTVGNLGDQDRKVITEVDGMTIGDYGSGSPPELRSYLTASSSWVEVNATDGDTPQAGTNLWRYDIGVTGTINSKVVFANFGAIGVSGLRVRQWNAVGSVETPALGRTSNSIDSDNEWTTVAYEQAAAFTVQSNYFYVYSVGNPVTYYGDIFYQTLYEGTILTLRDCKDIDIQNMFFRYTGEAIRFSSSAGAAISPGAKIHDCTCSGVSTFIRLGMDAADNRWLSDFKIYNNSGENFGNQVIMSNGLIRNGEIYNNSFTRLGTAESTGGFYFTSIEAPIGEEIKIYGNTLSDMRYARWWPADGAAYYCDNASSGLWFNKNVTINSHKAMHDNSGKPNNKFIGNVAANCDILFQGGDHMGYGEASTDVYNNTMINAGSFEWYEEAAEKGIISIKNDGAAGNLYRVRNNIVHINDNTLLPYGIKNELTQSTLIEEGNCIYNAQIASVDASNLEVDLGFGSTTTNPLLNSDYSIDADSPARNASVAAAIPEWFENYSGAKAFNSQGAYQFNESRLCVCRV